MYSLCNFNHCLNYVTVLFNSLSECTINIKFKPLVSQIVSVRRFGWYVSGNMIELTNEQ